MIGVATCWVSADAGFLVVAFAGAGLGGVFLEGAVLAGVVDVGVVALGVVAVGADDPPVEEAGCAEGAQAASSTSAIARWRSMRVEEVIRRCPFGGPQMS